MVTVLGNYWINGIINFLFQFCFKPFCPVIVFSNLILVSFFLVMNVCCAKRVGEKEIYRRPFTTIKPVPSDTNEEITVLIANLTQLGEAWSQMFCIWDCFGIGQILFLIFLVLYSCTDCLLFSFPFFFFLSECNQMTNLWNSGIFLKESISYS